MTIKEKIQNALKTKYAHLGLSQKVLETTANKIARRVGDDETKIDSEVADVEDDLAFLQSIADSNRTLAKKVEDLEKAGGKKTGDDEPDPKGKTEPEKTDSPDDEKIPAWAKAIIDSNKTLSEELAGFKKAEHNKTSKQKLIDLLTEKKVSKEFYDTFIDDREFADDEAIEAFANRLKESEDKYLESNNIKKLGEASETKSQSVFVKSPEDNKNGALNSAEQAFIDSIKPKEATPAPTK